MSGEHLITDDETRRIAEGFLSNSPGSGMSNGDAL